MKGDNVLDMPGVYGTQGAFSTSNKPGSRDGAVSWTDISGNFWLFGGNGYGAGRGWLNDLWKYDVATNRWAWMKGPTDINDDGIYGTQGVADPLNHPGARHSAISWIDAAGNLWLFGGEGYSTGNPAGFLNDLWKYSPSTNQWTWVSGDAAPNQTSEFGTMGVSDPGNKPGSRTGSVSWIDGSGMLWLFGGFSYDFSGSSYSNDLWRYDPTINEWTWMKGDFVLNQSGIYGTQTVPDINNKPGGRQDAGKWMDNSGNLWLFGGDGYDEGTGTGSLNDLWRYNIATNTWTWMNGDNTANQPGIYGTAGVASPTNSPGGRIRVYTWKDPSGLLWLYGGDGYGSSTTGLLNDLWKYNTSTNQWTWMKGTDTPDQNTVYGTQGTSSATTKPGSRRGGVTFTDPAGNLWLFGGNGFDAAGGTDLLNDLWKLGSFTVVPVTGLRLYAAKGAGDILLNWKTEQEINTSRFVIERSLDGTTFSGIGTVSAAGNSATQRAYYFNDMAPSGATNFYRIKEFDTYGFSYSNIVAVKMDEKPLQLFPVPAVDILNVQADGLMKGSIVRVTDALGRTMLEQRLEAGGNLSFTIDVHALAKGMYVLSVINGSSVRQQQFIKQ